MGPKNKPQIKETTTTFYLLSLCQLMFLPIGFQLTFYYWEMCLQFFHCPVYKTSENCAQAQDHHCHFLSFQKSKNNKSFNLLCCKTQKNNTFVHLRMGGHQMILQQVRLQLLQLYWIVRGTSSLCICFLILRKSDNQLIATIK